MGITLTGYICDNCGDYRKFPSMKTDNTIDFETFFKGDGKIIPSLSFGRPKNWNFTNIRYIDEGWVKLSDDSKCYCPKCSRMIKIKRIVSNIK